MIMSKSGARVRPFVVVAMLLLSCVLVPAQESTATDASIFFESDITAQYVYSDQPNPLGTIDSIRSIEPFAEMTTGIENGSGLGVLLTVRLISEFRNPGESNIPFGYSGNPLAAENNMVAAGVLYAPLLDGLVRLGRQKVDFGPSRLSGLQIDTHVPYLDGVFYSLPIGKLEISQVVATLENRRAIGDLASSFFTDLNYDFGISDILLSSRHFSWTEDRFKVGIGAQTLFSRPYNVFQLGDILPIFSVHNADVGANNFTLLFDFELTAIPEHRQYLVLGLDEVNANLFGINDSGIPTIWAIQGGVSGVFHFGSASMDYDAEVVATQYLWGSFQDDVALSRAIYRLRADGGNQLFPLSSPFGPARLSYELVTTTRVPGLLDIGCSGLLLYGDPSINLTETSYVAQSVSYEFMLLRLGLTLSRDLGAGFRLSVGGGGDILPDGFSPRLLVSGAWSSPRR
ncbi:MAG TPA: hypothetical protein VMX33_06415 [bacterium]|nr:hypothetical protein [bacterium]